MAAFSSWAALESALKTDLANNPLPVASHTGPDGRRVDYRTRRECAEALGWVSDLAAAATATAGTSVRRTYAKPTSDNW